MRLRGLCHKELKVFPSRSAHWYLSATLTSGFLLIQRAKAPNKGCWSPIGGKLDMERGESPYECARRETLEEVGLCLTDNDLHCFGYISEKHYEDQCHWLMFLFHCRVQLDQLPAAIDEGKFAFLHARRWISLNCRRRIVVYCGLTMIAIKMVLSACGQIACRASGCRSWRNWSFQDRCHILIKS